MRSEALPALFRQHPAGHDVISLVPAEEVGVGPAGSTALMFDERACIRCALCVERCPTDALSVGLWTGVGVPKVGVPV